MKNEKKKVVSFYENTSIPYLFVCSPTGIYFSAQVGGMACLHPCVEGFMIPLEGLDHIIEFNDCEYLCMISSANEENYANKKRLDAAREIENKVLNARRSTYENIIREIHFDFDRINELMEGWWPVKFDLFFTKDYSDSYSIINDKDEWLPFKGYIYKGNCD